MKILSSFTHPEVVPDLYTYLCSAEHKGRYSEECGKRSSSGAPLTSSVFIPYYGSQWCPKTAWLQIFFKISSFVFSRTKKFIQVWNDLRVSKWWQKLHFWVNYPFKSCFKWDEFMLNTSRRKKSAKGVKGKTIFFLPYWQKYFSCFKIYYFYLSKCIIDLRIFIYLFLKTCQKY